MISRRSLIKGAVGGALALPAVLRSPDALASSGLVNVYAWGDYFDKNSILQDFEAATGIKVNLSTYGSNEEAENKLRAAGGSGFDVIFPSVDTGPNYYKDGLLAEIDERRIDPSHIMQVTYRNSLSLGASWRGKRYLLPFDWGTEAITYDASHFNFTSGSLSYGDLWADGLERKVALRQKSIFTSIALYLDARGDLPTNRAIDMYKSEDDSRRIFDACLDFAVAHKKNFGAYWNNANEATAAFTDAGCIIGQTWDTTGILLNRKTDRKWRFGMPREGGLAWMDTVGIPAKTNNMDQAYAFISYLYRPEVGAAFSNASGYNSCAVGAENFLSPEARAAYDMAYAPGTIDRLWWWPMMTSFFARLRGEYVERLTNA
jgi:spermidine/putrescine transport system substrate-binding protein